jgi:Leucine-rich repeat (LRR) protein
VNDAVIFEQGRFGTRAVLNRPWCSSFLPLLQEKEIAELELNDGKGWHGESIEFIRKFPNLKALDIIDFRIQSVEPVHDLNQLRTLTILTYCKTRLQFSNFPFLEECSLEWRQGAESLFDSVQLKELFVNRYKGRDLRSFSKLHNLVSLILLGASIASLAGIEALTKLNRLRLGDLRRLQSLTGIENLTALERLNVGTCRKIGGIDQVARLSNLREFFLNNDGPIASLKPLDSISGLETVTFSESTNVLDGDLSPLARQPHLSRVSFQNRRHYSHRREDFWQYAGIMSRT